MLRKGSAMISNSQDRRHSVHRGERRRCKSIGGNCMTELSQKSPHIWGVCARLLVLFAVSNFALELALLRSSHAGVELRTNCHRGTAFISERRTIKTSPPNHH